VSVDLSTYRAIQTANFVRLAIPGYATLRFSDYNQAITIGGESYTNLGSLLNISEVYSELRAVEQEVTVALSGVPAGSVPAILDNDPRGSTIEIRAGYFNPTNNTLLPLTTNPVLKFRGMVTSYGMIEDWDSSSRTTSFTINLICNSLISLLVRRVAGRRTNTVDQQEIAPGDLSMSRVSTITRAQFQFGKPGVANP
jgi:hypothetical protein